MQRQTCGIHRIRRKGLLQVSPALWVCSPADPCGAGPAPGPAAHPAAGLAAGPAAGPPHPADPAPALVLGPPPPGAAFSWRTLPQGLCGFREETRSDPPLDVSLGISTSDQLW